LDQGDLRYAFIEGVTALEVAIGELIHEKELDQGLLKESAKEFIRKPLHAQVIGLASSLEEVTSEDIRNAVRAIRTRNRIVHEGHDISGPMLKDAETSLLSLLKMTALLIPGPRFRFVSMYTSNTLKDPEMWDD